GQVVAVGRWGYCRGAVGTVVVRTPVLVPDRGGAVGDQKAVCVASGDRWSEGGLPVVELATAVNGVERHRDLRGRCGGAGRLHVDGHRRSAHVSGAEAQRNRAATGD